MGGVLSKEHFKSFPPQFWKNTHKINQNPPQNNKQVLSATRVGICLVKKTKGLF